MNILSSMLSFLLERTSDGKVKSIVLDIFQPPGTVYISAKTREEFDPNTSWGGTWELTSEGKFLVGAGTYTKDSYTKTFAVGDTGGEATHKLTAGESGVKAHNHAISSSGYSVIGIQSKTATLGGEISAALGGKGKKFPYVDDGVGLYRAFNTANASGESATSAHNNMPQYQAFNIWVRIR